MIYIMDYKLKLVEKSKLCRTTEERDVLTKVNAIPSAIPSKEFFTTSSLVGSETLIIFLLYSLNSYS